MSCRRPIALPIDTIIKFHQSEAACRHHLEYLSSIGYLRKGTTGLTSSDSYLELSEGETAAGADLAVVLDGRASDNRTELVDGAGSQSSGLGLTGGTARSLLAGLEIQIMSITTFSKHWCRRDPVVLRWLGARKNRIPGRSACVRDAASPCGSLFRILSQSLSPSSCVCRLLLEMSLFRIRFGRLGVMYAHGSSRSFGCA